MTEYHYLVDTQYDSNADSITDELITLNNWL